MPDLWSRLFTAFNTHVCTHEHCSAETLGSVGYNDLPVPDPFWLPLCRYALCAKFDATAELLHVEGEILLCDFTDAVVRENSRSVSNTVEGQVYGCPNPACSETGCRFLLNMVGFWRHRLYSVVWLSQEGWNKSPHYVNEQLEHRTVVLVIIFSRHFKPLI